MRSSAAIAMNYFKSVSYQEWEVPTPIYSLGLHKSRKLMSPESLKNDANWNHFFVGTMKLVSNFNSNCGSDLHLTSMISPIWMNTASALGIL